MDFPDRGYVFWPVGNGDSTTIVVDPDTFVQIDINHCEEAGENPQFAAVIDELVAALPTRSDGKKYLAAFGLSHADADHCRGFERLLKDENVVIGDLWVSPRILWERDELCDDALAFCAEADRRIAVNRNGAAGSGDRIRIIGDAKVLEEYSDLPAECFVQPGQSFSAIDGVDHAGEFHAFVHAPSKEDAERERNATSIALRVALCDGAAVGRAILFGDLHYETLKRIFDESDQDDLEWNVLLAPHHCSDSVMYVADEDGGERTLRRNLLDALEAAGVSPTCIVSSSIAFPSTNTPGDNPPHVRARVEYEKITERLECTGEWPNVGSPKPIVFHFVDRVFAFRDGDETSAKALPLAIAIAQGETQTPAQRQGYGRRQRA